MAPRKKEITSEVKANLELPVLSAAGKEVERVTLDSTIFDGKVNHAIMHQAVVAYLANQRKGLASAKTRGEVSGGGRKPWKQKGTGRARSGSSRSPIWKGGGITFGPKPHSFTKDFPQKMKAVALKSALNSKLKDNEIIVLDALKIDDPKTKKFLSVAKNIKIDGLKSLLVLSQMTDALKLSVRNLKRVGIQEAKSCTTYDVLSHKKLVLTKDALQEVESRIKKVLQ